MLAPPPGFSQPTASFVGHCRLGIHLVPVVAFVCFRTAILPRIVFNWEGSGRLPPGLAAARRPQAWTHQPPDTQRPGLRRAAGPAGRRCAHVRRVWMCVRNMSAGS